MSVLTEKFPTMLNVGGTDCPINPGFRTVLRCYEIQGNKTELPEKDLIRMLCLIYKKERLFSEAHIDQMFW